MNSRSLRNSLLRAARLTLLLIVLFSIGRNASCQRFVKSAATITDLLAINPQDVNTNVFITDLTIAMDGLGGVFTYRSADTNATNTSTIFKPYNYAGRWIKNVFTNTAAASSGSQLFINGSSVTNANFTNSSTVTFTVSSTNVSSYSTNIADAQISASAAIALSKLATVPVVPSDIAGAVVNSGTPADLDFLIYNGTAGTNAKPLAVTGTGRGVKSSGATVTNFTHVGTFTQSGSAFATEDFPNGVILQSSGNLNLTNNLPVRNESNVVFQSTITDSAGSVGTSGQYLKSTATATAWTTPNLPFTISGGAAAALLADGATYYVGDAPGGWNTTEGRYALPLQIAGTIVSFATKIYGGTIGSSENVTVDIWLNNATSVGSHTQTWDSVPKRTITSGLSQAVISGDYIELRVQSPTWVTNPNISLWWQVYIKATPP